MTRHAVTRIAAAGLAAMLVGAPAAHAAGMTILSDHRSVHAEARCSIDASWGSSSYTDWDDDEATAPSFDATVRGECNVFTAGGVLVGLAEASQSSVVGPGFIAASGDVVANYDTYNGGGGSDEGSAWWEWALVDGIGESLLDVVFSVPVTSTFELTGSATPGFRIELEALSGAASDPFSIYTNTTTATLAESGSLLAGTYRLYARSAYAGYAFEFAVVPEPGTFGLMGLGLVALGAGRRR